MTFTAPWKRLLPGMLLAGAVLRATATIPDIPALQQSIAEGRAAEAMDRLAAALEYDPDNARLLYDHGVAAYAAGKFEEALLSLDRAETSGRRWLRHRARFQMGNAEYRIGLSAKASNL
ncbi:MAG: tetratricopeptide repeat protein, partial [Verrucomicrobia bacterium]|nr:tetratricopeptide repeat protein [Verrucomicrobiota bacterium]